MRNLRDELGSPINGFNLHKYQIDLILDWINTLTNQDLEDNGSRHAMFPVGHGDVTPPDPDGIDNSLPYHIQEQLRKEKRIDRWIVENLPIFKQMDKNPEVSGRIQFVKSIKTVFDLTLLDAKELLDKNWYDKKN